MLAGRHGTRRRGEDTPMRALITGATGFAGSFLVEECLAAGWEVHGTALERHPAAASGVTLHSVDLRDVGVVARLLGDVAPDRVFHLAGQASVGAAWADPASTLTDNLLISFSVLDAVRAQAPTARVLVVGSSEEYGVVPPEDLPVRESQPLRPVDPYGVSKVAVDYLALQQHLAHGLHVVRMRPFNHIGPRQRQGFVVADWAAQLAAIERGEAEPVLHVGNLDVARDFTDVRDIVRGYRLALEGGAPGSVYNICSGEAVRIGDLLRLLLASCAVEVRVEQDPAKQRPADVAIRLGSYDALRAATGWRPQIPLARTLADTLDYWRRHS